MKKQPLMAFVALIAWIVFLFIDAIAYKSQYEVHYASEEPQMDFSDTIQEIKTNIASGGVNNDSFVDLDVQENTFEKFSAKQFASTDAIDERIDVLQKIYEKTQDADVLDVLLEKLVVQYQYEDAYQLIKQHRLVENNSIDPYMAIHVLFNSSYLSVLNPQSITKLQSVIDQYRNIGAIGMDDYRFLQALISLWNHDYSNAKVLLKQIQTPRYLGVSQHILEMFAQIDKQMDIPQYYQDSLIALSLFQNGYFTLAQRLALQVTMQDENYILPYQILGYAHFLTQKREPAIEYLLKLVELDSQHADLYRFFVGVSYYWLNEYEEAVLYLTQVENGVDKVDTYRYLLLSYIAGEDKEKMIQIWQHILSQKTVKKSDFQLFFYEFFFRPYREGVRFKLYEQASQLAEIYLLECGKRLDVNDQDICLYGQAGLDIAKSNFAGAKEKLLYLAEHTPSSYIFHALGDYYYYDQGDKQQAKQYYIKAISMTESENEKVILNRKLVEFSVGD